MAHRRLTSRLISPDALLARLELRRLVGVLIFLAALCLAIAILTGCAAQPTPQPAPNQTAPLQAERVRTAGGQRCSILASALIPLTRPCEGAVAQPAMLRAGMACWASKPCPPAIAVCTATNAT